MGIAVAAWVLVEHHTLVATWLGNDTILTAAAAAGLIQADFLEAAA